MNRTWTVFAVGLAAAASAAGCGYNLRSDYRPGIRTVAVPVWRRGTQEYRRDIEIRLTEALVKHIEASTPYKVVDASRADTLLAGTLKSATQRVLTFDPRMGRAREIQLRLIADFTWKDLRSGEILVDRKDFRVATTYIPEAPLSEDFFLGSEDAVNKLARRVIEQMKQPW